MSQNHDKEDSLQKNRDLKEGNQSMKFISAHI